jgi:hypothetical protein
MNILKKVDNVVVGLGGLILDNGSTVVAGSLIVGLLASEIYSHTTNVRGVEQKPLVIPPMKKPVVVPDEDPAKAEYHRVAESIFKGYGLPVDLATTLLRYESDTGDLMVSKTGCLGWYQFSKRTAKQYGLKNPMDLVESSHATAKLMIDNKRYLLKKDRQVTNIRLYLSHMLGSRGNYYLMLSLDGEYLSKSQRVTLGRVIKPNWVRGMGKYGRNTQRNSERFMAHVEKKFSKFQPVYT